MPFLFNEWFDVPLYSFSRLPLRHPTNNFTLQSLSRFSCGLSHLMRPQDSFLSVRRLFTIGALYLSFLCVAITLAIAVRTGIEPVRE